MVGLIFEAHDAKHTPAATISNLPELPSPNVLSTDHVRMAVFIRLTNETNGLLLSIFHSPDPTVEVVQWISNISR